MRLRNNIKSNTEIVSSAVIQVKIDEIRPNRAQPRVEFDTNSIIRLADSIRRYGILQPLSVRLSNEPNYKYELIAGERRLRAARSLGYYCVPCIVVEADEKMSAELAIIENLLREDLNMFEQAYAFRQLIDNYSLTQEEIARKVSLSQSAIANKLRLLRFSYDEQCKIVDYELTERHARALLRISDKTLREEALEHIAKYKLNVLSAEQYVDRLISDRTIDNSLKSADFEKITIEKTKNDVINIVNKKISAVNKAGFKATVSVKESIEGFEMIIKVLKHKENAVIGT